MRGEARSGAGSPSSQPSPLVAITAGAMLLGFRDERRLADQYRATLAQAHGQYFGAVPLADAAGRQGGVLFVYRGAPSWIVVTVTPPHRLSVERAELVDRSGRRIPLASFRLADGAWGGSIPIDLGDPAAVHLVKRRLLSSGCSTRRC